MVRWFMKKSGIQKIVIISIANLLLFLIAIFIKSTTIYGFLDVLLVYWLVSVVVSATYLFVVWLIWLTDM